MSEQLNEICSREFRNAMGQFTTGVVVISNEEDGQTHAMTANAFMSGSLEPPLIVVSVGKNARMHERLERGKHFGVSLLSADQMLTSNHFAGKVSEDFQPTFENILDVPVLSSSPVRVVADICHSYPCGDHTLFVGKVKALDIDGSECSPLLFHKGRYAELACSE